MKNLTRNVTLTKSVSALTHGLLRVLLPVLALLFVSVDLTLVAFILVLISKWRILAVKSRYWGMNFRSNMVDLIVGISLVEFMRQSGFYGSLAWTGAFVLWILYVKKLSKYKGMITQALIAQAVGVSALLYNDQNISLGVMTVGIWFVAYFCARHAISAFEEDHAAAVAHVWGLFAVQLAWILGHWHVWFWFVHQIVLLLSLILTALVLVYALKKQDALRAGILRQISATTGILVLAIIVLSDWQSKTF